ncbi:tetraspanin-16 isoform X1 [Dipodomys spectabilis]|uniref:tetraspanin-16 isoform X1 n=1 Tax=Dipodomys spectabilis TaxID=105255 RepID=UPI001C54A6F0|nr:tetraspanin-16 isoform X1 [Dipodomys spectabilis]
MTETHTPYSSLKKLISCFNGVVAASGVTLIALGLGVKYGRASMTTVLGLSCAYLLHFGYLFLVLGCVIIPLALAGWYGATKESRGTLLFCFLFMVTILIVEITATSVILAFFPIVRDVALEHNFATLRKNYKGYNEPDDFSAQWNLVMEKLKCCGVNNYTDFSGSSFQMTTGHTYPRGCCKSIGTPTCDGQNVSTEVIHHEGCFSKLLKITRTHSLTLSGVSLGAAMIQLPGILATLLLFIKLG